MARKFRHVMPADGVLPILNNEESSEKESEYSRYSICCSCTAFSFPRQGYRQYYGGLFGKGVPPLAVKGAGGVIQTDNNAGR